MSSMKFVLNGMGLLRINLEDARNRVSEFDGAYVGHCGMVQQESKSHEI